MKMNYKELQDRYYGKRFRGYGHFKVSFLFRGKIYSCVTTNTVAIDRLTCDEERIPGHSYVTKKQALMSLYEQVKRVNDLH